MVNGKTPLYLTVVAALFFGAAVFFLQPYTADFPGTAYAEAARNYLHGRPPLQCCCREGARYLAEAGGRRRPCTARAIKDAPCPVEALC